MRKRRSGHAEVFGRLLRQLRAAKDWSGREAAKAIGCSQTYYRLMESGQNAPGLDCILAIAKAFELPPGKMLDAVVMESGKRKSGE